MAEPRNEYVPPTWCREWGLCRLADGHSGDHQDSAGRNWPRRVPTCPRCGAYPGGCVRGCRGESQANG